MLALSIVVLEKVYPKRLGLQEILCPHPVNLNVQGPQKDLTLSHWRLVSIHRAA
jgi:hypothetical protein